MLLLIAVALTAVSCSGDMEIQNVGKVTNLESPSLLLTLDSINESISHATSVRKAPNNGGMTTKDKITIAIADGKGAYKGGKKGHKLGTTIGTWVGHPIAGGIAGAVAGAVVVGGLKSYLKYKDIANKKQPDVRRVQDNRTLYNKATNAFGMIANDSLGTNNLVFIEPSLDQAINVDDSLVSRSLLTDAQIKVGLTHNLMVAYLDGKIAIQQDTAAKSPSNQVVKEMFESQEFITDCINIASGDTPDTNTDLPTEVMKRFTDLYEMYVDNCNDVAFIISKYIEVIDASPELSPEDKENLKYGFATALFSTNYWSKELK